MYKYLGDIDTNGITKNMLIVSAIITIVINVSLIYIFMWLGVIVVPLWSLYSIIAIIIAVGVFLHMIVSFIKLYIIYKMIGA